MDGAVWLRSKQACKFFGVCPTTLRRWADCGEIDYRRTNGNQRVYRIRDEREEGVNAPEKNHYLYVRVSSSKQKDDLERQICYLQNKFPNHTVIKDIGSGLNYKRKGLLRLLALSNKGLVKSVTVASKDRLCRFGFELIEWMLKENGSEIVVLDKVDKTPEQEFTEDILAILQVFSCRWNGKRKYSIKNKKGETEIKFSSTKELDEMESHL